MTERVLKVIYENSCQKSFFFSRRFCGLIRSKLSSIFCRVENTNKVLPKESCLLKLEVVPFVITVQIFISWITSSASKSGQKTTCSTFSACWKSKFAKNLTCNFKAYRSFTLISNWSLAEKFFYTVLVTVVLVAVFLEIVDVDSKSRFFGSDSFRVPYLEFPL